MQILFFEVIFNDSHLFQQTQFELTFSKLNLTPVGCLTYLLPKLVGPAMASYFFFLCLAIKRNECLCLNYEYISVYL